MRALITALTTIGVGSLLVLDNPQGAADLYTSTMKRAQSIWSEKEIRIAGLDLLKRSEVERLLPVDRSVLWWQLNRSQVEAKVAANTWVSHAKLSSCSGGSLAERWGCFLVAVEERQPLFTTDFKGDSWVIDRQGVFVAPLVELLRRNFVGELISVRGVADGALEPSLVRAQLSAAAPLCDTLSKVVGRGVQDLEFLAQGDFAVRFKGLNFPVVFAAGKDAGVDLEDQGARFAALLKQIAVRLGDVERIDLAFDRVGVVRFREVVDKGRE
jgi:hypothetical protein